MISHDPRFGNPVHRGVSITEVSRVSIRSGARTFRLALLAMITLAAAGCATRVTLSEVDPTFARQLAASPQVALGGVVVGSSLEARLSAADADAADDALYRAFISQRPDLKVWPRPAIDGRLEPGQLDSLRHDYAAVGRLRPEPLRALAPGLGDVRFLALVRLDADQVRTVTPVEGVRGRDVPGAEGVPEDGERWGTPVSTERRVALTLQVFDLVDGAMVWEAAAESRARQRYAYRDALSEDATYVRDRLREDPGPSELSREGVYLQTPDLIELLDQALSSAVARMPGTTS